MKNRLQDTPLKAEVTIDHLRLVINGEVMALELGHELLLDAASRRLQLNHMQVRELSRCEVECMFLGVGFWTAVDRIDRAVSSVEQMIPRLASALAGFVDDRARWRKMRDDAVHAYDRLYRELRRGANDPEDLRAGARSGWYNPHQDQFETGASVHLPVTAVVDRVRELINKLHDATQADQLASGH